VRAETRLHACHCLLVGTVGTPARHVRKPGGRRALKRGGIFSRGPFWSLRGCSVSRRSPSSTNGSSGAP
jgi:hypothetical protein